MQSQSVEQSLTLGAATTLAKPGMPGVLRRLGWGLAFAVGICSCAGTSDTAGPQVAAAPVSAAGEAPAKSAQPGLVAPPSSTPASSAPPPQSSPEPPDYVVKAVAASDRSAEDRALDSGRNPQALLTFFEIAPGMRVGELGAGGGYTTELLARVVGPAGKVYAQNSKFLLERFLEKPWSFRLAKPVMSNVVRVDRDFDDPLPADAQNLDAVLMILFYHDTVWLKTDRARMNRNILASLKPGGVFGIVDHSATPGHGLADTETLHRIDEEVLRKEVLDAGFELEAEASFLRRSDDARDWNASPRVAGERRGTSDRFVLRFRKPNNP
jgi:predicted methyltransferase